MALPIRELSTRTVESVLELIYLWFPELVCVRQSANSVREPGSRTEQSFRVGYFVEFGNRLNSHELVYAIERLITKDDLALNANDCIISGMPKANRGFIVHKPIQ